MTARAAIAAVLLGSRALAGGSEAVDALAGWRLGESAAFTRSVEGLVRAAGADPTARARTASALGALLSSTATEDAKRFALGQLSLIGAGADVPAISALLADPGLADAARMTLERIPGGEAEAALVSATGRLSGTALAGVAVSLGERRDPAGVGALAGILAGGDSAASVAAAAALGRICDPAATRALLAARRTAAPALRDAVTDACLECASSPGRAGSAAILGALAGARESGRVRGAVLLARARSGGAGGWRLALGALDDPDPEFLAAALRAVREMPAPPASIGLRRGVAALPSAIRARCIDALGGRADGAGRAAALDAVAGPDERVRRAGLRALGRIGDSTVALALARASATLSGPDRDAARESLDSLSDPGTDAVMIAALARATPAPVRAELARSLGARGSAAGEPSIERLVRDPEPAVRMAAIRSLAVLGDPEAIPVLVAAVAAEPEGEAADAGAKSAATLVRGARDPAAAIEPVLSALTVASPAVQAGLLGILPAGPGPASLAAARKCLSAGDDRVARAALRALGEWATPEPLADLMAVATTQTVTGRRVLALRGAARLAALPTDRPMRETVGAFSVLLAAAPRPEDARVVLAGLARVPDPGTLALAASKLEDSQVREEAATAVLEIAKTIGSPFPDESAAAVERALRAGLTGKPAEEAAKLLADLEKTAGFVASWEVAGPYTADGSSDEELLDQVFPPEDPAATGVAWKRIEIDRDSEKPWQADLLSAVGGEHRAAYLRVWLWSSAGRKARFEMGSDDGVKVWLNGKVVHANNAKRPLKDGDDEADIRLGKGWNALLVKVTQGEGGWGFSLRVRDRNGNPLRGVRASLTRD